MATPGFRVRLAFALPGAGIPDTWYDVTAYVRSIDTTFGRSQNLDVIEAATAKIVLLNVDGRFTPGNTAGPYNAISAGVRPFNQIEVEYISDDGLQPFTLGSAVLSAAGGPDATLYDVTPSSAKTFRGLVSSFTPTWLDGADGGYAAMQIDAVDFFAWLQRKTLPATAFVQQTVGARIAAVLAAIGNPFPTDIDTGGATLVAETQSGNALSYLRGIATLDGGLFYCRGGTMVFKSRLTVQGAATYLASQAVLGDQVGEFRGTALHVALDEAFVVNRIIGNISSGTPITPQESLTSQSYYLIREKDFGTTSMLNLAELTDRAKSEIDAFSAARWRVDGVDFELHDPNLDSLTLINLDMMNRVTVKRRPAQGDPLSVDCFVQGFTHSVTPESWKMTVRVSSVPEGWMLGVSALGSTTIL